MVLSSTLFSQPVHFFHLHCCPSCVVLSSTLGQAVHFFLLHLSPKLCGSFIYTCWLSCVYFVYICQSSFKFLLLTLVTKVVWFFHLHLYFCTHNFSRLVAQFIYLCSLYPKLKLLIFFNTHHLSCTLFCLSYLTFRFIHFLRGQHLWHRLYTFLYTHHLKLTLFSWHDTQVVCLGFSVHNTQDMCLFSLSVELCNYGANMQYSSLPWRRKYKVKC